jgi:hypothetical protein
MQLNRLLITVPLAALALTGCGEDPLGPDNRMALIALGQCRHAQALLLADNAMQRGTEHNAQRALMLKAAILRDAGDEAAAEALYPAIDEAWQKVKKRKLKPNRREREIGLFLDVAKQERQVRGIPVDCSAVAAPNAPQPAGSGD